MLLGVRNLKKTFRSLDVLKGIDLSVNAGDAAVILGPSGAGKTTLLRCMNFLETADDGELIFGDQSHPIRQMSKADIRRYRMNTAFVFQNFNLFLNRTALGNVTEGLITARGMDRKKAEEIGKAGRDRGGLLRHINHFPHESSR